MKLHRAYIQNGWTVTALAAAGVMTLLAVIVTYAIWRDIAYAAWTDEESSHILLVPVVAAWLFWVRRSRLRHLTRDGFLFGPVLALAGGALMFLGDKQLWDLFWHLGALMLVLGAFFSVMGRRVAFAFAPVLLILLFLIPVPGRVRQQIAVPLQSATAAATQEVGSLVGLDVTRSGNLLNIDGRDVAVAEACNGMRMFFALMLVCVGFAFATPLFGYVRILLILATPLAAIVFNVIRLVPTVWVVSFASPETVELFHDLGGWVMLFVAFSALTGLIHLLTWLAIPVRPCQLATA